MPLMAPTILAALTSCSGCLAVAVPFMPALGMSLSCAQAPTSRTATPSSPASCSPRWVATPRRCARGMRPPEAPLARLSWLGFSGPSLLALRSPCMPTAPAQAIICNVTPATCHTEESHSTLRFACRAKRVVNNAVVNEVGAASSLAARMRGGRDLACAGRLRCGWRVEACNVRDKQRRRPQTALHKCQLEPAPHRARPAAGAQRRGGAQAAGAGDRGAQAAARRQRPRGVRRGALCGPKPGARAKMARVGARRTSHAAL